MRWRRPSSRVRTVHWMVLAGKTVKIPEVSWSYWVLVSSIQVYTIQLPFVYVGLYQIDSGDTTKWPSWKGNASSNYFQDNSISWSLHAIGYWSILHRHTVPAQNFLKDIFAKKAEILKAAGVGEILGSGLSLPTEDSLKSLTFSSVLSPSFMLRLTYKVATPSYVCWFIIKPFNYIDSLYRYHI